MNKVQKIIKYIAIAFALFLAFTIISTIARGILSLSNIFDNDNKDISEKLEGLDISGDVKALDINVLSVNITLKKGDSLTAETNNKNINVKQDNNKLIITEEKQEWFKENNGDLIIYIPSDFIFDGVSIEAGAGKVNIEELSTKKLYLELGAGKVDIDKLLVSDDAKIDGGAGQVTITNGNLKNLDLDMGIGKLTLNSMVLGTNKIDSGIGKVDLKLIGDKDSYKIHADKGIGNITVDSSNLSDDSNYGNGDNYIDIDGGIGNISISFANE